MRSHLQNNQAKRAGEVAQAIECLLSKCEALVQMPIPPKKKKRKEKK
jgi:hypothetical protein